MKKVTIPTCANPFVVIVNGIKYTYPAGETVEVPDDVAAVIEQHDEAHNNPAPDPAIPPYSSGAKSWNDLTDKPFGDESVTIEWDGDSTGKVTLLGGVFTKVSDLLLEPSDLIGGTLVVMYYGEELEDTLTDENLEDFRSQGLPLLICSIVDVGSSIEGVYIAYEPFSTILGDVSITVTEPGIYFVNSRSVGVDIYTKQLTYGSIKKLDPKFLPSGGVGYDAVESIGDTLTWDGTPTDTVAETPIMGIKFYRVSDSTPTLNDLLGGYIAVPPVYEGEITAEVIVEVSETVLSIGDECVLVASVDGASCEIDEVIVFPKKGVYFAYAVEDGTEIYTTQLKANGYNFTKSVTHKIDKKFLPEGVGGGLPVVELETVAVAEETTLSEADAAKMAALNGGMCILKINVLGLCVATGVTDVMTLGGAYCYGIVVPSLSSVIVTNIDTENGAWICKASETV